MSERDKWHLLDLAERSIDGQLGAAERAELNTILRESPEARALYASALHQHAELRFDERLARDLAHGEPRVAPAESRKRSMPAIGMLRVAALFAALALAAFAWVFTAAHGGAGARTIATVVKARQCKWAGSTLPTAEGSRVTAGTLELVEGIATVKFDSGAEVVMEAPATLEITNAMACKLVRGTLMAQVPQSAKGFTVQTPDAKVVDYGTRFGVSTGEDGKYHVQVLEGLVEVSPNATNKPKQLRAGDSVDTGLRNSQLHPQINEQEPNRWQPNAIMDAGGGWQIVSTAFGRGKDSYIQSSGKAKNFGSDPFFRVKHSSHAPELNRKGYIGFDVNRFAGMNIEDAELVLSIEPSDLGFASLVPDSTFDVYGLTDETQDTWDENGLTWTEAPAQDPAQEARHLPMPSKAVLLGRFEIPQGVNRGTRTLRGKALEDFLKKDTNGLVTFIICRETDETTKDGLVHAFATKESGNNTPPLLRVKTK